VGVVGPNGAGKSTLLRALQGLLPLASGTIEAGETVTFGYYEQSGLGEVSSNLRVQELVQEAVACAPGGGVSADADEKAATSLLSRFLFPPRRWHERVEKLSGGERRRLQMLRVLARQPNFLLLDEPTNDLDLDTIGVLEDFLRDDFDGVLVVVSHDRYFLDKVVDHLFVLPGDDVAEVRDWQASFSEYLVYRDHELQQQQQQQQQEQQEQQEEEEEEEATAESSGPPVAEATAAVASSKNAKPLSNYERNQLERLEEEMESLTGQQSDRQRMIDTFDPARNGYSELSEWTEEVGILAAKLADVELKWLELADRADL